MSNAKYVVKNSMVGMIAQLISMTIGFISQRIFLNYLGLEIVGINSVVTETLGFLTFAELGVGTAISFRLYKPLVKNDTRELGILMQLYRSLYQIIGCVVFVLGTGIMFVLPVFINDASYDMPFIYAAYLIQLVSTSASYFFAHKRSLIFVDQKQYVCKIADLTCNICFSVIRIMVLVLWKNYHLYLLLQLLQTLTANIFLARYCNKHYPFVKVKTGERFHDIKGMFKDTKDVLLGRVAGYVYSSTDNVVISTFSGITVAGGFSNYRYVTNAVKHLAYNITDSIVATIGNNVQLRTEEENYEVLRKYTFCRYVLGNIAATGLCICTDSFVSIVFGEQYLLNNAVLYLIVADIFIGIVYGPLGEYITVLGYFRYEKYINLIGALINIGLSIGLVQFMGVEGVLIGTVVSQVFFWIAKSVLLCRKYFESKEKLRQLWKDYLGYTALLIIQVLILHLAKNALWSSSHGIITFIGEGIASVSVSLIMVTIFFGRSEYYQYLMNIGKKMISKFIRK